MTAGGFSVDREQIVLNQPIKALGLHTVPVSLHPEVEVTVTINIARSPEEAERQARGEKVTDPRGDEPRRSRPRGRRGPRRCGGRRRERLSR